MASLPGMVATTFARIMPHLFGHEGGYVDHKDDPGGATKFGITHKTLAAWRGVKSVTKAQVKALTKSEATNIYQANYWNVVRGDDLPAGVDYAVFDFAINSGPARAAKFLQKIVDVKQDGVIGSITLGAVKAHDPRALVRALCDDRLKWLRTLAGWKTFGKGWERRVTEVRDVAQGLASGVPESPTPATPETGLWASLWRILGRAAAAIWKGLRK